jgi:hypothetical protein
MTTRKSSDFQVFPHFYRSTLTHIETPAGTIRRDLSGGPATGQEMWIATYNGVDYSAAEVGDVVKWLTAEWLKMDTDQ